MSGPAAERQGGVRDTFTFLFTDIEGSTRLLQVLGERYAAALQRHHTILQSAVEAHGGTVRRTEGDSFFATFPTATAALAAAVDAQRRLGAEPWPPDGVIAVRMGLHTGEALIQDGEVVGLDVHRAARIMSVGWGGQILVSAATRDLVQGLGDDVALRDLGEHRLKDLAGPEHVYQVAVDGLRDEFPPIRSLDAVPNNLPTQLTPFVGRERELAEIVELLGQTRLLTLTGPGGTGKSRLSLQAATAVADDFPDGVFFVRLAAITDPSLVSAAIAGALGLTDGKGRPPLESVAEHLADRQTLLVLDNFEQLLDAAPDVSKLLASAPRVKAIVSSRAPLRVYGEQEYPVPPMTVPEHGDPVAPETLRQLDAVELFVARATAVDPNFALDATNAAAVVDIVRRLDGLPLALELAAARVKLLPPAAIAERLMRGLDLLSSGARDLPDRQRTLRGAIAWSDDLLDAPVSRLLHRFAVFAGGATLEEVEAVCGEGLGTDTFDALAELVDHSLVRRSMGGAEPRFTMLQTIREYGLERLAESGEDEELRRRHLEVYLALAERLAPELTGSERGRWLDRLEAELDNLRQALAWAIASGEVASALRLVAAVWRLWQGRGHLHEARRHADAVVALPGADRFPRELAGAYEASGGIAYWQADLDASRRHYERALELYRGVGDESCIARGTYNLAFAHILERRYDVAAGLLGAALAAYERLGDPVGVARTHWGLAVSAFWSRDLEDVKEHTSQCIPVFRDVAAGFDLGWALHMHGLAELSLGDVDAARAHILEGLDLFQSAGDVSGVYLTLADVSLIQETVGQHESSIRLHAAATEMGLRSGTGLVEEAYEAFPRPAQRAEDLLDAETVERLREEGRAMSIEDAVAEARAALTAPPTRTPPAEPVSA